MKLLIFQHVFIMHQLQTDFFVKANLSFSYFSHFDFTWNQESTMHYSVEKRKIYSHLKKFRQINSNTFVSKLPKKSKNKFPYFLGEKNQKTLFSLENVSWNQFVFELISQNFRQNISWVKSWKFRTVFCAKISLESFFSWNQKHLPILFSLYAVHSLVIGL